MKIKILWPGKTRNEAIRRVQEFYLERIGHLVKCEIIEIKEARGISERYENKIKTVEAEGFEKNSKDSYIICLSHEGKEMSSVESIPDAPKDKQLQAIRSLARATKSSVDLKKIASKQEASRVIEELIAKRGGRPASNGNELKDRKCGYGLATKLIFGKYLKLERNHVGSEQFWKEVDEFYSQYMEHQGRAIRPGSCV